MSREFNIKNILFMLLSHLKLMLVLAIIGGIVMFSYTTYFIRPIYSASALLCIRKTSDEIVGVYTGEESDTDITSDSEDNRGSVDFSTSEVLSNFLTVLFKTDGFMKMMINDLNLKNTVTVSSLKNAINIKSENGTQFMRVTVTTSNPKLSADLANAFARLSNNYYYRFFKTGQIMLIESAKVNNFPISPNIKKNTTTGVIIGFIIGLAIAVIIELIDTTVKPDDDLYKMYKIPVFAEIVDYEMEGRQN